MADEVSRVARHEYVVALAQVIFTPNQPDPKAIAKLYQAFVENTIPQDDRLNLLDDAVFRKEKLNRESIVREIMQADELRMSLGRDALSVGQLQSDEATQNAVSQLLNKIHINPEQASVLNRWVSLENDLLKKLGAGQEWLAPVNDIKELTARAAAIGIPLASLYGAGIVGFSAVGITSGLAAIGGYTGLTVLGLNPMTAGIAGLIAAGVTIKKLADYALQKSGSSAGPDIEKIRSMQRNAAIQLASDIPDLTQSAGIWRVFRRRGLSGIWKRQRFLQVIRTVEEAQRLIEYAEAVSSRVPATTVD